MLVINSAQVSKLLSVRSCVELMETVLLDLAREEAVQQLRSVVPLEQRNVLGLMPAYLKREQVAGVKTISVFPENNQRGFPSHQGVVSLFDASNGELKAIVDAEKITAIRTAAVSAAATKRLAREDASVLGVIGTGEQARTHLEAMLLVRPIERVNVWGRDTAKAVLYADEMSDKFDVPIRICDSARDAVADADIVCTATASTVPVVRGEWMKPVTHVNAIGACKATDRELDTDLVKASKFYVDSIESTVDESGDYLIPLQEGEIDEGHIVGEIGALLLDRIEGRQSETCITVFKSLGLAVEDLAAANYIYQEAIRVKTGTYVEW